MKSMHDSVFCILTVFKNKHFPGENMTILFEMFLDLEREAQGALRFVHQLGAYR
jgi:hypothetical protein